MELDRLDINQIKEVMDQISEWHNNSHIKVRRITFDVYDTHRVTASRRSRWSAFCIRKIEEINR